MQQHSKVEGGFLEGGGRCRLCVEKTRKGNGVMDVRFAAECSCIIFYMLLLFGLSFSYFTLIEHTFAGWTGGFEFFVCLLVSHTILKELLIERE
ncbi:hypothetical protein JQN58_18075 [Aneurinibacillus sp. BA2021]|nr:hypothetical protein [Aneurinibacillus sp. BA2021]